MNGAEDAPRTRAFVIHPVLRSDDGRRDPDARLEEACGLAEAIDGLAPPPKTPA